MGYMKKLIALIVFSFLFTIASPASAREGSIDLTSSSVSCKGISLFQSGSYRIFGRCDGLVYPHETTYNKYVLWGKTIARGELIRIGAVEAGYFSGNIASPFGDMVITAETDNLVRKPSDKVVVSGKLTVFDFDKSKVTISTTTTTTPAASTAPTGMTVQDTTSKVTAATSTAGSVIGRILTSLLVIILVIVGIAIGASLIFRNRGSVSH